MKILTLLIILLSANGYSQELKDFTVPSSYKKIVEVKGDLDKDSVDEIVYVYNGYNVKDLGYKRVLYICKNANGIIKLWKKNSTVLFESNFGFPMGEENVPTVSIKNNILTIEQNFAGNSRRFNMYKDIYRYQNNDWYLIGSNHTYEDNCEFNFEYDINFSTKKVEVSLKYGSCDDDVKGVPKDQFFSFKYPFPAIPKFDGFIPGKKSFKIPKSTEYFYY